LRNAIRHGCARRAAMLVTKGIRTMKTLPLALILTLSLASATQAETIVDGVIYPEITELGRPRTVVAQPQLGSAARRQNPVYTARQISPLPAPPLTGSRNTTIAPADIAPALTVTSSGGPTVQSVPAYNQATYGYGYTSVGTPQRVVYVQPAAYSNLVPAQQVVPVTNIQPLTTAQPLTNVQPLATTFNPYAGTGRSVPWRPIVNVRTMPDNYVVGQGLIGQPKVYVPNQPLRNFVRWITP
jgi:hypothetical protein